MTISEPYPISAQAEISDLAFAGLRDALISMAQDHGLPTQTSGDDALTVEVPAFGQYRFSARARGVAIQVTAALPDRLHMLKEGITEHLKEVDAAAAQALRWSDAGSSGVLPPNVHFTTVESITPLGADYLRVRVRTKGLKSFQDDAIHFRLLLPPAGCTEPDWPRVDENGATIWPKGEKALHRPVYTTRRIDHHTGIMEFDIFLHEGGRATAWAQQANPGDRLAIAGPGGGGIPDTSNILMFADETALPAVARILETLPQHSQGQVTLLTKGGDRGYPISAPQGISLSWIDRGDEQGLMARALSAHRSNPESYLWFACEKSEVQKLRAALSDSKPAPGTSYIAAYWSTS